MLRNWLIFGIVVTVLQVLADRVQAGERRHRPVFRSNIDRTAPQSSDLGPTYAPAQRTNGLPMGRNYYGGRYFGNFNNRFYGPQYGYF